MVNFHLFTNTFFRSFPFLGIIRTDVVPFFYESKLELSNNDTIMEEVDLTTDVRTILEIESINNTND